MSKEKTEQEYIDELWQFPCPFTFKAMAYANRKAEDEIAINKKPKTRMLLLMSFIATL